MQKITLLAVAFLALNSSLAIAQSDEEAIKALIKNETTAFFGRKTDVWESTLLHDANVSRTTISNGNYFAATGWEKNGLSALAYLKANANKPDPMEIANDNYQIRLGGNMAWVEYDQTLTRPSVDPKYRLFSHEQRLLVKEGNQWKIATMNIFRTETFKPNPENIEASLNTSGYQLLEAKKVAEAIEVFKANVKINPESWNAYDSLGEAYALAGNKDLAIQNYEQSLKLNPKSEGGKTALAKLKQ